MKGHIIPPLVTSQNMAFGILKDIKPKLLVINLYIKIFTKSWKS